MIYKSPDMEIYFSESFAAWPDVIHLQNGDILVFFREDSIHMISPTGKIVCRRSRDRAKTWLQPTVICDHPGTDDRDPIAYQTKDGTIWVGVQEQREKDYDTYLVRSYDNGISWEKPIKISHSTDEYFVSYPRLELSNGEFLWAGCSTLMKTDPDGSQRWVVGTDENPRATFILKNPDNREGNFEWEYRAHQELGLCDEWDIVELEAGHLITILRQQKEPGDVFYQSESFDYGKTWTKAKPTTIKHTASPSRPAFYKLDDTLIAAYAERKNHRIVAIPSFDGGRTWRADRIVTICDDPAYCGREGVQGDWDGLDFSYPAVADAGDDLLFVYYAYPNGIYDDHRRGIYGTFVPKETFGK